MKLISATRSTEGICQRYGRPCTPSASRLAILLTTSHNTPHLHDRVVKTGLMRPFPGARYSLSPGSGQRSLDFARHSRNLADDLVTAFTARMPRRTMSRKIRSMNTMRSDVLYSSYSDALRLYPWQSLRYPPWHFNVICINLTYSAYDSEHRRL